MKKGNPEPYIDIGQSSVKVLLGDRGLELPLERLPGGEMNPKSRDALRARLREFLGGAGSPKRAFCAVPAQGVSLRRIFLPAVSREELMKILALQIEKELPLPPEKLAWGYEIVGNGLEMGTGGATPSPDGERGNGKGLSQVQEATIAAVRREVLEDYARLLGECGLRATFYLGVLAGGAICPRIAGLSSVLDIGRTHSELLNLNDGKPLSVRSLTWGGETVTLSISKALGIAPPEAEKVKRGLRGPAADPGEPDPDSAESIARSIIRKEAQSLVKILREAWSGSRSPGEPGPPARLFLLGGGSRVPGLAREIARFFGDEVTCTLVETKEAPGGSAAILGLRSQGVSGNPSALIGLNHQVKAAGRMGTVSGRRVWTWIAATVLLAMLSLSLRYATPLLRLGGLRKDLARAQETLRSLPGVDRELGFLGEIDSQTPFLDAVGVIAASAPKGTQIAELKASRQGEISFQGSIGNYQEVSEFRRKLSRSGWFSEVALLEEAPTKDGKRVDFRLAARLLAPGKGSRPPLESLVAPEILAEGPAPPPEPEPEAAPPPEEPPPDAVQAPPPPQASAGTAPGRTGSGSPRKIAKGSPLSSKGKIASKGGSPGGEAPPPEEQVIQNEAVIQGMPPPSGEPEIQVETQEGGEIKFIELKEGE